MMQRDGRRLQIALELLHHVGVLPGQIHVGATEVAIGGSLLVDGAAEIQVLDDLAGRMSKHSLTMAESFSSSSTPVP